MAAEFGGLLKLEATNAVLDFGAFVVDAHGKFLRTDGPFIRFGGTVPPAYDPADESTWAVNQVDSVDGSLSISFSGEGNPLAGLGGKAGNFGIGFNPEADLLQLESPIDFYQLPDFFVTFSLPEEGGFGFPDWLPISIREIGLRFPDVFGDLLPSGGPLTDDSGNAVDWIKSGFDTLTNFNLLFSGGLQGSPSGWPITFELEDTEVSVVLLRRYAEKIIEAVADNLQLRNGLTPAQFLVNDPADSSGATQISLANLPRSTGRRGCEELRPAAVGVLGPAQDE